MRVLWTKLQYDVERGEKTLSCEVRCRRRQRFDVSSRLVHSLAQTPGILRVAWE